jgi:histidine ammonia-lyase
MSPIAARKLAAIVENLAMVLAIELMVAFQAMEFLRPLASSGPIERVRTRFRTIVAPWSSDRELAPDIAAARAFLDGGAISKLVESLA